MKTAAEIAADLWRHVEAGNLAPHNYDLTYEGLAEIVTAAIAADRAQRPTPVVVIRGGIGYENGGVDVIDLDFLEAGAVTLHSDYDQADIDRMLATLEGAGFTNAAADVREWWDAR